MVYVFVAGVWVSGTVLRFLEEFVQVRLVTGSTVLCPKQEMRSESPRLSNSEDWPV